LQKEAQICVVGKVFRPNKSKVLALNKTLSEYLKIVTAILVLPYVLSKAVFFPEFFNDFREPL
jgi:hypothetical protein